MAANLQFSTRYRHPIDFHRHRQERREASKKDAVILISTHRIACLQTERIEGRALKGGKLDLHATCRRDLIAFVLKDDPAILLYHTVSALPLNYGFLQEHYEYPPFDSELMA